jgi:hypothetical protein
MGPCAIDPIPGTYASIARYSYFAILLSESGWERNKALADFNLTTYYFNSHEDEGLGLRLRRRATRLLLALAVAAGHSRRRCTAARVRAAALRHQAGRARATGEGALLLLLLLLVLLLRLLGRLGEGLVLKSAAGKPLSTRMRL